MKRWLILAVLSGLGVPSLAEQRVPLVLEGQGPWYRLSVPMSVQLAAAHGDLRDLRVLDGAGQTLPYALLAAVDRQASVVEQAAVRLFPLRGGASEAQPGLRVRRGDKGTIVEVLPGEATSQARLRGWLVDASRLEFSLERLQLTWRGDAEGFQRFSVEASDDLEHWRSWGEGQIARFSFGDERIDVSEVRLPGGRARYLRLLWPAGDEAVTLERASLSGSVLSVEPAPMIWTDVLAGRPGQAGEYFWALPGALPLRRAEFVFDSLPQHTIAPLALDGRARAARHAGEGWTPLASGVLYRLPSLHNEQLELPGRPVRELRLRVDPRGTGLGEQTPGLKLGMPASELLFLVRGEGEAQLAFGDPAATSASLSPSVLVPNYSADKLATFGRARVGDGLVPGSAAPQAEDASEWKRIGLWAVLLGGVALLAAMVFSLLRTPAKPE